MKITIIESDKDKFTKDEYKYLQLLEEDVVFESYIFQARMLLNVPKGGYPQDYVIPDEKKKTRKLHAITVILRGLYNLPRYWTIILSRIIYFGIASPYPREKLPHFYFELKNNTVSIHVSEKMSLRELKKRIDSNGTELSTLLKSLPGLPKIKMENILVKKRILELKREKKKDAEIALILEQEYGDELTFSPEYYIVSIERKRFENSLKSMIDSDSERGISFFEKAFNKKVVVKRTPKLQV